MENISLSYNKKSKLTNDCTDGWNDRVYPADNGIEIKYQLYLPKNFDSARKYPCILYMHSSGVRCDNNLHIYTGEAKFLRNFEENSYKDEAIILAPCCPKPEKWVDVASWDCQYFDTDTLPQSGHMAAALEVFSDLLANMPIDKNRLYLYGMSMGGFAEWDILARYPHVFAAAIVVAGCGVPMHADRMVDTAIWIFHGAADKSVSFSRALDMQDALLKAGKNDLKFTSFENAGHGIWTLTADTKGLYDWLFSQRRKDLPQI